MSTTTNDNTSQLVHPTTDKPSRMTSMTDLAELARATKPNTISVIRTSDYNGWVHPQPPPDYHIGSYENLAPRRDYVLTGIVVVNLAKARRAKKLVVDFICEARLAFPDREWEDDIIFERTLEIGDEAVGLRLDAGPQTFDFSFVVPSTIAGFDRNSYGRITHRVEATLIGQPPKRFGGLFKPPSFSTSSNATPSSSRSPSPGFSRSSSHERSRPERSRSTGPPTGMGMGFKSNESSPGTTPLASPLLSPTYSSSELLPPSSAAASLVSFDDLKWLQGNMKARKDLWILPIPSDRPEAISLDYASSNIIAGLGVMRWSLKSDAIAVGSYVKLRCALVDEPPKGATIHSIRLYILQTFALRSPRRPDDPEMVFPPNAMLIVEKGRPLGPAKDKDKSSQPLWSWKGDGSIEGPVMSIEEIARLPDEKRLRPSTCPGTITPLRVKNEFSLHVFFSIENEDAFGNLLPEPGPGSLRRAELTTTVLIPSCACITVNFAIPSYEESMASQRLTLLDGGKNDMLFDRCACDYPLDQLAERELERGSLGDVGGNVEEDDFRGRQPHRDVHKAEYRQQTI